MALKVYRYYENFRRMGSLTGLFLADEDDVDEALREAHEVYLGECLGKHSEVYGTISRDTVVLVSEDPVVISFVETHLNGGIGTNIIQCWKDREEYDEEA